MLSKLRQELESLKKQRLDNLYLKDSYSRVETLYKDHKLGRFIDRKIEQVESLIREIEKFTGEPHEWQGNEITLSKCENCPIADDCKVYNNWMNRPARKRFDPNGDVIEYDKTGNLKYQVLNFKTGEKV